jgi:zinc protease
MKPDRKNGPGGSRIAQLDFPHNAGLDLGQGRTGWIYPTPGAGVARLYVVYPGGMSAVEKSWFLHAATHLQLSGNDEFSAASIQEQLESLGASAELSTEGRYCQLTISAQTQHIADALKLWLKFSDSVTFPESEIEVYRSGAISDLQSRQTTPRYWSQRRLQEALYGNKHYLGRFSEIADIQEVNASLLNKYSKFYPGVKPYFVILCGDVDNDLLLAIGGLLGAPQKPLVQPSWERIISEERFIETEVANTNQVSISMGKAGIIISEEDYYAAWLLNTLLGGFFGSRLMKNIREEKGLTYGIHSSLMNSGDHYQWSIQSEVRSGMEHLVLDEIKSELNLLCQSLTNSEELDKVKQYLSGNLKMSFDGVFSMAGKRRELNLLGRDDTFYDKAIQAIHETGSDKILELANNFLIPETFHVSVAGLLKK